MNNLHKGAANNVTGCGSVLYEMNQDSLEDNKNSKSNTWSSIC